MNMNPRIQVVPDLFDREGFMQRYTYTEMEVDGVHGENKQFHRLQSMVDIRSVDSDNCSPMLYRDDGYPIDEKHFLETGFIQSTNPSFVARQPK